MAERFTLKAGAGLCKLRASLLAYWDTILNSLTIDNYEMIRNPDGKWRAKYVGSGAEADAVLRPFAIQITAVSGGATATVTVRGGKHNYRCFPPKGIFEMDPVTISVDTDFWYTFTEETEACSEITYGPMSARGEPGGMPASTAAVICVHLGIVRFTGSVPYVIQEQWGNVNDWRGA